MKKIETISADQIARFPAYVKKWTDIGLSTEAADFESAEKAALEGYRLAGLPAPMVMLRVSSPYAATMGGALAWMMLREMGQPVKAQVQSQVWDQVQSQVRDQVRSQVVDQVWDQVWAQVGDRVWDQVRADLPKFADAGKNNDMGGQLWAAFASYVSFLRDEMGWSGDTLPKFSVYEALATSCGWVWWHQNVCAISDRPSAINRDAQGRLHCEHGKAIEYRDGWGFYAIHGVRVPEQVVMSPETLTVTQVQTEENAEVRRVMIERMGYDRYVSEAGLKVIDQCGPDHKLQGLRTARLLRGDDIVLLDMLNSTPEPDGSIRRYILAIDADAYDGKAGKSCLAAMASTWRREHDMSLMFPTPEAYLELSAES